MSDNEEYINFTLNDAKRVHLKANELYLDIKKDLMEHIKTESGHFKYENYDYRFDSICSESELESLLSKDGFTSKVNYICETYIVDNGSDKYDDYYYVISVTIKNDWSDSPNDWSE